MNARRQELAHELERYYRACGWPVEPTSDGTIRARGAGGVVWIGLPITVEDLGADFAGRLLDLSEARMPDGARCPVELLPDEECAAEVESLVSRLGLGSRVSVYSFAA